MDIPRRHHHLPKFLLRRFGTGKKKYVWVFDKSTGKKFKASPTNVAVSRDLYSIAVDSGSIMSIEPSLAEIEGRCASYVKRILRNDDISVLDAHERIELAVMMIQLHLRSPNFEKKRIAMFDTMRQQIRDLGGDPDDFEELRELSSEEAKLESIQMIRNLPGGLAPHLLRRNWALHSTRQALFLSDNPVVLHHDQPDDLGGGVGFAVPGVQVFFPISSTRCLAIYCPSLFGGFGGEPPLLPREDPRVQELLGDKPRFNKLVDDLFPPMNGGKSLEVGDEVVSFLNSLQVSRAERYLISQTDDFSLAEKMLRSNPELRVGPRPELLSG